MIAVDKAADAGISENTRTYGAVVSDFLVLKGGGGAEDGAGPVELIAFFRS